MIKQDNGVMSSVIHQVIICYFSLLGVPLKRVYPSYLASCPQDGSSNEETRHSQFNSFVTFKRSHVAVLEMGRCAYAIILSP